MSEKLSKDELISRINCWLGTYLERHGEMREIDKEQGDIWKTDKEYADFVQKQIEAKEQFLQLIEAQAEPNEELVQKKTSQLFSRLLSVNGAFNEAEKMRNSIQSFLRKLLRKPKVDKNFMKVWADFWNDDFYCITGSSHTKAHIEKMLEEAGVEVEE